MISPFRGGLFLFYSAFSTSFFFFCCNGCFCADGPSEARGRARGRQLVLLALSCCGFGFLRSLFEFLNGGIRGVAPSLTHRLYLARGISNFAVELYLWHGCDTTIKNATRIHKKNWSIVYTFLVIRCIIFCCCGVIMICYVAMLHLRMQHAKQSHCICSPPRSRLERGGGVTLCRGGGEGGGGRCNGSVSRVACENVTLRHNISLSYATAKNDAPDDQKGVNDGSVFLVNPRRGFYCRVAFLLSCRVFVLSCRVLYCRVVFCIVVIFVFPWSFLPWTSGAAKRARGLASLVFNVAGHKIKAMNKWIRIKIQNNKTSQNEIRNTIQQPNSSGTDGKANIYDEYN